VISKGIPNNFLSLNLNMKTVAINTINATAMSINGHPFKTYLRCVEYTHQVLLAYTQSCMDEIVHFRNFTFQNDGPRKKIGY